MARKPKTNAKKLSKKEKKKLDREVALMMNNSGDSFGWSELY